MPSFNEDEYFRHTLDMLGTYSASQILEALKTSNGKLTMHYENDAKVEASSLELTFTDCSCANVAEVKWNIPEGGGFSNENNWLEGEVPGQSDDALFDYPTGLFPVSFSESVVNNTLRVTSGAQPTFALAGNTYTLNRQCGDRAPVSVEATSALTIENGTLTTPGRIDVSGENAQVTIGDGGHLTAGDALHLNGGGTAEVFDGGELAPNKVLAGDEPGTRGFLFLWEPQARMVTDRLVLGHQGQGEMLMTEGRLEVREIHLGEEAGSEGQLDVGVGRVFLRGELEMALAADAQAQARFLGEGTRLETAGPEVDVTVGTRGQASFTLEDKAAADIGGLLCVGREQGSQGTLTVSGEGTDLVAEALALADQGGQGLLTVSADALATVSTTLFTGQGSGEITVSGGGSLTAHELQLGRFDQGRGTLRISGEGQAPSEVVLVQNGILGQEGTAEVTVEQAGQFVGNGGFLLLGQQPGSTGVLTVRGTGSLLRSHGTVTVGGAGEGDLTLSDGAEADDLAALVIGRAGLGSVSVRGKGTQLAAKQIDMGLDQAAESDLFIDNLAEVATDALTVGQGAAVNHVFVTGHAVLRLRAGTIGAATIGQLFVGTGGFLDVRPATLIVGSGQVSRGALTVDGTGSVADLQDLYVGFEGFGAVSITGSGALFARQVVVGFFGDGNVLVDGPGSLLEARALCLGCSETNRAQVQLKLSGGGTAALKKLRLGSHALLDVSGGVLNVGRIIPPAAAEGPEDGLATKAQQEEQAVTTDTLFARAGAIILADTVFFHPGGVLGGSLAWPFPITNQGTITPGDSASAAGTFTAAAGYAQTAEGALEIELGGSEEGTYDRLEVTGMAALGGTLRVRLVQDFVPRAGQTFEIVRADSLTGRFAEVVMPSSVAFDVVYEPSRVVLTVLTVTSVAEGEDADGADVEEAVVPSSFVLAQNYPNPFNPRTVIGYALPRSERVRLVVYDGLGREVAVLVDGVKGPGHHEAMFDAGSLPSGVYLYRLEAGVHTQTRRLTLLK